MNTAKLRTLVGVMTTLMFLGIGLTLISTPNAERIGALLCALAVFRGALVARELWPESREDDEEREDP